MEQTLLKELQDTQWYLGEERARRQQLEQEITGLRNHCADLQQQLHNAWQRIRDLEKELADTQWYLGEERARRQELENQLKSK
ncbi:MAG: hypothetical protein N2606_00450 [Candidatus Omnitrophica bacterium]|nr:hypothetical protein [Candidatus Omnitrophota bacterium]